MRGLVNTAPSPFAQPPVPLPFGYQPPPAFPSDQPQYWTPQGQPTYRRRAPKKFFVDDDFTYASSAAEQFLPGLDDIDAQLSSPPQDDTNDIFYDAPSNFDNDDDNSIKSELERKLMMPDSQQATTNAQPEKLAMHRRLLPEQGLSVNPVNPPKKQPLASHLEVNLLTVPEGPSPSTKTPSMPRRAMLSQQKHAETEQFYDASNYF